MSDSCHLWMTPCRRSVTGLSRCPFGRVAAGARLPSADLSAPDRDRDHVLEEQGSPLRVAYMTAKNRHALQSATWPENFESLRKVASWMVAIFRVGSAHQAALALGSSRSATLAAVSASSNSAIRMMRDACSFAGRSASTPS